MIGEQYWEREIMMDVLLLPEMSRAERAAGRAKKTNNSHCRALRRRCRGEAAPSGEAASRLNWKGKVTVLRLSACQPPRLGTRPGGLGKLQALTIGLVFVLEVHTNLT
jgi:hypothetical protein